MGSRKRIWKPDSWYSALDRADIQLHFEPVIDLDKLRGWKNRLLEQLTGGLKGLARKRKVNILQGHGKFVSDHLMRVSTEDGEKLVGFEQAIIAVGSSPVHLRGCPEDPRIITSTGALE